MQGSRLEPMYGYHPKPMHAFLTHPTVGMKAPLYRSHEDA